MAELKGFRLNMPLTAEKGADLGIRAEGIIARAGVQIWCANPQCGVYIGTFRRDLYTHTTVAYEVIDFAPSQRREASEYASCKLCGTGYLKKIASIRGGSRIHVHTRTGWI